MPTINVHLPKETADFIREVARQSGVSPDQAASVITVLAMRAYLGPPPAKPAGKPAKQAARKPARRSATPP
jgi:hypothetical protein